jgi:tetratricopeptide (TPR) repeat protein
MASTWTISLDQVRRQDEDAAELLAFLAYLSNRDIWYELIKAGVSDEVPWISRVTENKIRFQRAMSKLNDYNLVDVVAGSYQVHPCLHDWLLESLNTPPKPLLFITALTCIADNIKGESSPHFWVTNRRLLEHAEELESPRFHELWQLYASEEKLLDAAYSIAGLLQNWNWLEKAEEMYIRALVGKEKALGPDHTSTLATVNNLGNLYRVQGKLAEAEQMYVRALAGYEKALGPDHTSTLDTVNSLGTLYRNQGKLAEAERMYQRALVGYEKALQPETIPALKTVSNLARLYRDQGKTNKAEEMFQRAIMGRKKILGSDHPATLKVVNALNKLSLDASERKRGSKYG